jgi:hypothetical protein
VACADGAKMQATSVAQISETKRESRVMGLGDEWVGGRGW